MGSFAHANIYAADLEPIHAVFVPHNGYIECTVMSRVRVNGLRVSGKAVLFQGDKIEMIKNHSRVVFHVETNRNTSKDDEREPVEIIDLTN